MGFAALNPSYAGICKSMTTHRRSRKQRYAEDADYREKIRAYQRAWNAAHTDEVNAERRRSWAENPARRQQ
jgi:hypothetical protein